MKNQIKRIALIIFMLIILSFSVGRVSAQAKDSQPPIRDLRIGDTIPNLVIQHLLNGRKKIQIAELYKPGLLIINFWATWCSPCVTELPKLVELKAKFPDQLNVLSVGYEDSTRIRAFFSTNKQIDMSRIFCISNDILLSKYFKHYGIPHNVWINQKGIVAAITNEEEILTTNVSEFLKGQDPKLKEKKDILNFRFDKPFHLADSSFSYRSILSKYIDGIGGGYNPHGSRNYGYQTLLVSNQAILDLFYMIHTKFRNYYNINYKIVQVNTKDSVKFFRPKQITNLPNRNEFKRRIDWDKDHTFCYELTLPKKVADTVFCKDVLNDLCRVFDVSYRTEERVLPCDVITVEKKAKYHLENFRGKPDSLAYASFFKYRLTLKNATITDLIHDVLSTWDPKEDLWVDETGIDFPINLVIDFDKSPSEDFLQVIKDKLLEYGLKIEMRPHKYPIMILDDLANN